MVALAGQLGLEIILGAFLAGALVGVLDRDTASHPTFRRKLEAIGYGFCIPVFFVASGARLDLQGLVAEPAALLRVPAFLLALLLARGLPALLYRNRTGWRGAVAAGLLQATSLPFLVTAGAIGIATGTISPVTAAALTCAGLVSVMIFPTLALVLLRPAGRGPGAGSAPADHDRARREVLQAASVRSDDQRRQRQADQQSPEHGPRQAERLPIEPDDADPADQLADAAPG